MVYLHDTPSQVLFDRAERTFSSGCVRVERALELAELVLNDPERWNSTSIADAISSERSQNITLKKQIPVLLTYWTAWVDPQGVTNFRQDVYGQDAKWAAALDAEFKVRAKPLFSLETVAMKEGFDLMNSRHLFQVFRTRRDADCLRGRLAAGLGFLKNSPIYFFTQADLDLMNETALAVLNDSDPEASKEWSNSKTGYSGRVQSLGRYRSSDGEDCRKVKVWNQAKGLQSEAIYPVCKTASGDWQLASGKELTKV